MAGVRGVEAEMRGGVPVLGGDDVLVIRHATVYGVDDGGAVGDGEAAGDEVVLNVDSKEGCFHFWVWIEILNNIIQT